MRNFYHKLFSKKISLKNIILIPLIIQILLISGIISFLSFHNSQKAVNNVSNQLINEIIFNIENHLTNFMKIPHQINEINKNYFIQKSLNPNNIQSLNKHFFHLVQIFPSVTSIYFGNSKGHFAGSGREGAKGNYYITNVSKDSNHYFNKYSVDKNGKKKKLLMSVKNFNTKNRPWYRGAKKKASPLWNDIYILFTGHDMAISASSPVYSNSNTFMGVVSIDIFLSHISTFLENLKIGKTGLCYIVEPSGLLVATSTNEKPFVVKANKKKVRLSAKESSSIIIRKSNKFIIDKFKSYKNISNKQEFTFPIDNENNYLKIMPIKDSNGLNWFIVVVIPKSDFMSEIKRGNLITVILIILFLIITLVGSILITHWISKPITLLNESTQALSRGEWNYSISKSKITEIFNLTSSFSNMSKQLKKTMNNLMTEAIEREETQELLKESLKEKEALLRELYHRTKNNMGVISAMLQLQSEYLVDDKTSKIFIELENKIQSMALVHQMLYQSQNLSSINLTDYVKDLCDLLLVSYKKPVNKISFDLEIEEMEIIIDVAIPFGLVLNELISNAFKHAFPDNMKGVIHVHIYRENSDSIVFKVFDNGIGIQEGIDPNNSKSLGLQTVYTLVHHQLQGNLKVDTKNGVEWTIHFNDMAYNERI